jgi:hypothetical protein
MHTHRRKHRRDITGFFGCATPATFARRASLRLRMTSDFDASAWRRKLRDALEKLS